MGSNCFISISMLLKIVMFTNILVLSSLKATKMVEGQGLVPPVSGLAYGFYNSSCPNAESIVQTSIQSFLSSNVSQAAGVIRLFFHDCFVQGCDASLLVNDTNGEQTSIPNLTLRASALAIIDQIKSQLEASCPGVVSCADILSLAARECVNQSGGPFFQIPTGRRDSLNFSNNATVLANIPAPTFTLTQLINSFSSKGLNETDLVALSGAHTIGLAHCSSFSKRLGPPVYPTLNATLAASLQQICPNSSVNVATNMDVVTPDTFDNQYFINNLEENVLFTSDASLLNDTLGQTTVQQFANSSDQFFQQFSISMIEMSMIEVLTGSDGNIRNVCSVLNTNSSSLSATVVLRTTTVEEITDDNYSTDIAYRSDL